MFRKFLSTAAVAVAVAVLAPATSQAQFTLVIGTAGATETVVISTSGAIISESGQSGVYGFSLGTVAPGTTQQALNIVGLTVDGYSIDFSGATSNNTGTPSVATLNISAFSVVNNNSPSTPVTPLEFSIGEAGFTAPTGATYLASQLGSTDLFSGSSITSSTNYDNTTTSVNESTASSTYNGTTPLTTTYSNVFTSSSGSSSSGFTLTNTLYINNLVSGGTVDTALEGELVAAPAPSGLILGVTVVPFLGLLRRRLRQLNAPVAA